MYDGYLEHGGVEIVNVARTLAYLEKRLPNFPIDIKRPEQYENLPTVLRHGEYRSPVLDDADWVSKDDEATHRFFGLLPLSISGVGDSTMEAVTTQSILDGGTTGSQRDGTLELRVRGLLIGEDELAVEAGMTWLRNALRDNSCGMHGTGCNASDLRYFLAAPSDVCDPLFLKEYQAADVTPSGRLTPGEGRRIETARPPRGEGQWLVASWAFQHVDGLVVRYGVTDELEDEAVTTAIQRTNFVTNPSFRNDVGGWQQVYNSVTTTPAWSGDAPEPGGGSRTYMRIGANARADSATNWLPDPSFENLDPSLSGWRSNSTLTREAGSSGAGSGAFFARATSHPDGAYIEVTLPGPSQIDSNLRLNWSARSSGTSVRASILDYLGAEIWSSTQVLTANTWATNLSTAPLTAQRGYVLRLQAAAGEGLDLDRMSLLRNGLGVVFDGDTADTAQYDYSYPDGFTGPSRRRDLSAAAPQVASASFDFVGDRMVLSFDARSTEVDDDVTVRVKDGSGALLFTRAFRPTREWSRISLGGPAVLPSGVTAARGVQVEIVTRDTLDLDQMLLEVASDVRDYFDGDSVIAGYEVEWQGPANASTSRMRVPLWNDLARVGRHEENRTFSLWLEVLEGSIQDVQFRVAYGTARPLEDQMAQYDRSYHRAKTTVGVRTVSEYRPSAGAMREVEFAITAGDPLPYSTRAQEADWVSSAPTTYADSDVNLVTNPRLSSGQTSGVVLSNLLVNPRLASNQNGWSAVPGTGGVAALTNPFGAAVVTWTTATTAVSGGTLVQLRDSALAGSFTVAAGKTYRFAARVTPSKTQTLAITVRSYDALGALISTQVSTSSTVGTSGLTIGYVFTLPALTAGADIAVSAVAGGSNWASGDKLIVDYGLLTEGDATWVYFDGDTKASERRPGFAFSVSTPTYRWRGLAHASVSEAVMDVPDGISPQVAQVEGGEVVTAVAVRSTGAPYAGHLFWRKSSTGGSSQLVLATVPVVAGINYSGVARAYKLSDTTARQAQVTIVWRNELGAVLSETVPGNSANIRATGASVPLYTSGLAPAGAVSATLGIKRDGGANWAAGESLIIYDTLVAAGSFTTTFTGDNPDSPPYRYRWTGAPDRSTSVREIAQAEDQPPVIDPALPIIPTPPRPPSVLDFGLEERNLWNRYLLSIDPIYVSTWANTIPTLEIQSLSEAVREIRVRFYPNPFKYPMNKIDPTSYCGEFFVTYMPPKSKLTISGVSRSAWISVDGQAETTATHLVYGALGDPISWPELSCDIGYVVSVDIAPSGVLNDLVDLSLFVNRRE